MRPRAAVVEPLNCALEEPTGTCGGRRRAAAAPLRAQQLVALVELVVADRVELQARCGSAPRPTGSSRNSAEMSGEAPIESPAPTTTLSGIARLQPCHVRRDELRAAHGRPLGRRHRGVDAERARRLQVAVEVVERDHLDDECGSESISEIDSDPIHERRPRAGRGGRARLERA